MTVDEVVALAVAYYQQPEGPDGPFYSSGHNLHVVLDDGNLENRFVAFALLRSHDEGDGAGEQLALALLDLSPTQRGVAYRRLHTALRLAGL